MKNYESRRKEITGIARPAGPLEALGTVSVRETVGHSARRLQPWRHRLGLFSARSRPLSSLPMGRGWHRRDFGPSSTDLLCACHVEWQRPHPEERLFGLTGNEGNHGEDVKEHYFYLDSTPTHSYMKALYKYPQGEFPYHELVDENRRRSRHDFEFELLDAGIFDENRYFDVITEYAKATAE